MTKNEFAINILEQYREKPTLINEIGTVEEAVWLDEALDMSIKALKKESKKGYWISDLKLYGYGKDDYHCSICGRTIRLCRPQEQLTDYPYCHCGAKMVEPQESEDI